MSCDEAADLAWLDARIAKTQALIVAIEDALLALSTTAVQSYMLNTGQTTQQVTKANVASLNNLLAELEQRLTRLQARRCGDVATHIVPGF